MTLNTLTFHHFNLKTTSTISDKNKLKWCVNQENLPFTYKFFLFDIWLNLTTFTKDTAKSIIESISCHSGEGMCTPKGPHLLCRSTYDITYQKLVTTGESDKKLIQLIITINYTWVFTIYEITPKKRFNSMLL